MKNGKNVAGRIARLQLGCEGMCNQVVPCALLVFIQSIIDDELEVRGSGSGRVRHEGQSEQFVRRREGDGRFCRRWGSDGAKGKNRAEALQ